MPTLSFMLSALLVGAGSIYMYLSQTQKIDDTKKKIAESNKVTYIAKKSSLTLSSVQNIDTNNSINVIATTGDKLSNFVSRDDNVRDRDLILLDRCQTAMAKIIASGETIDENSIPSCQKLKNINFDFYGLNSEGVDIPEKSILRKNKIVQKNINEKIKFSELSHQVIDKKIALFEKKKNIEKMIEKIKVPNLQQKYKDNELAKLLNMLKKLEKERESLGKLKESLVNNINEYKQELNQFKSKLDKEKSDEHSSKNNHSSKGMMSGMMDNMSNMVNNFSDNISTITKQMKNKESKLEDTQTNLSDLEYRLKDIDKQINLLKKRINNKKGVKDV